MIERTIEVERMEHVISVFGSFDRNLSIIESELGVKVLDRENKIHICGEEESVMLAEKAINGLLTLAARGREYRRAECEIYPQARCRGQGIEDKRACQATLCA